jgi:hypothetical protein
MNISDIRLDSNAGLNSYRELLAPLLQVQQEGLKAVDRFARYEYALAGDCLKWSLAQFRVTLAASNPNDFFAKQAELGIKFSEQLHSRIQELARIESGRQDVVALPSRERLAPVATIALAAVPVPVPVPVTAPVINVVVPSATPAAAMVSEVATSPAPVAVAPRSHAPVTVKSPASAPTVHPARVRFSPSLSKAAAGKPLADRSSGPKGQSAATAERSTSNSSKPRNRK